MKKQYEKPVVVVQKAIEALAGTCNPGDGDTGGIDKQSITEGTCTNIVT